MQPPDAKQALAMFSAFESVGVRSFEVTFTDIEGEKTGYQPYRSLEDLRRTILKALHAASEVQQNFIVRPSLKQPQLVQLDDLDAKKAERVAPHAFMVLNTSPRNFQAWLAVSDAPKDKVGRLRKGAGVDKYASGATRVSGSVNFKTKYAPEFPLVTLSQVNAGHVVTVAELDAAGIVAAKDEPRQPRPALHRNVSAGRPSRKKWPSYKFCLDNAPLAHGDNKPDTSRADFTWCRTAIEWGWSIEATASRLLELSAKAKENGERYATLTATRAAESVERQPYRAKSTPRPS